MKKLVGNGFRISLVDANRGINYRLNSIRIEKKIYSPLTKIKSYHLQDGSKNSAISKLCYDFLLAGRCEFDDNKRQKSIEVEFKKVAAMILSILAVQKNITKRLKVQK